MTQPHITTERVARPVVWKPHFPKLNFIVNTNVIHIFLSYIAQSIQMVAFCFTNVIWQVHQCILRGEKTSLSVQFRGGLELDLRCGRTTVRPAGLPVCSGCSAGQTCSRSRGSSNARRRLERRPGHRLAACSRGTRSRPRARSCPCTPASYRLRERRRAGGGDRERAGRGWASTRACTHA